MNGTPYYQPYWLNDDELEHYGVLGMKWGVRRYQNADGTLTAAGRKRARQQSGLADRYEKKSQALGQKSGKRSQARASSYAEKASQIRKGLPKDSKSYAKTPEEEARSAKLKKAAKIGTAVAAAGAVSVAAIMAGNSRAAAGAVTLGTQTISQLLSSGMLSQKQAANLVSENLKQNGSRSLGLSLWDKAGNPYYNPGMSDKEREMMATVMQYYLNQKR